MKGGDNLTERDYEAMAITFGFIDWRKFMEFVVAQEDKNIDRQLNVIRNSRGMVYAFGRA